jgi:hypothetical protein
MLYAGKPRLGDCQFVKVSDTLCVASVIAQARVRVLMHQ